MARVIGTPNSMNTKRKDGPDTTYTKRNCLNCRTEFDSWGIGNRICAKCKSSDAYKSYQNTTSVRFR
jgi:hypothetical protein